MISLLTIKEKVKNIYAEHEFVLQPVLKFIFCFLALVLFKINIGAAPIINTWPVVLGMAIVMAFLPKRVDVVIAILVMIFDSYYISLELAGVISILFVILLVLFLRFTPKQGIYLVLVPLAFYLKIPFVIPIVAGIISTPIAIVSVSFGTIIYYLIDVVNRNKEFIVNTSKTSKGSKGTIEAVSSIVNVVTSDPNMYLAVIAFAITIALVYGIKRRSVDHSWQIAVVVGSIFELVVFLVGGILLNSDFTSADIAWVIIGSILSFAIAYLLQLLVFSVDYSRTENTQFEDDEYYYYVKAVPKINVTAPEMNVKRINAQRRKKSAPIRRER